MTETQATRQEVRTEAATCQLCGRSFERPTGRRGRPQEYCDADCRTAAIDWTRFVVSLSKVAHRLTVGRIRQVRGDMWSLLNTLFNGRR